MTRLEPADVNGSTIVAQLVGRAGRARDLRNYEEPGHGPYSYM